MRDMRYRLFALLAILGLAFAAPIREIKVVGADPVLATLARIALPVSVGDEAKDLSSEALIRAVKATGYFQEVQVDLTNGVLTVRVKPNPPITSLEVQSTAFPPNKLADFLANQLAIAPGSVYNPKKVAEAEQKLAELFRQQGFPFKPKVKGETRSLAGGVALTFVVEESPPVHTLKVQGASLVPKDEIVRYFKPLLDLGKFSWPLYLQAVQQTAQRYAEDGYKGSGVDPRRSQLKAGVLELQIRELKVTAVDPDGLAEVPVAVGDPYNYDHLVNAVAKLSRKLGREVSFQAEAFQDGVRIRFRIGQARYGRISTIEIRGATAFDEDTLKSLLVLKPGDVFNPQLAEADFERIYRYYQAQGFALVPKADYSFQNGVYRLTIREIKIGGYTLVWEGPHRTKDFVVLRELPKPGSLFSVKALREGLGRLLRTGIFKTPPEVLTQPGKRPDERQVLLKLKEGKTLVVTPAIAWSSTSGWSGQLSLSDKNLWGRAHQADLELSFVENDAGDNLSLSLSYKIPWLYLDFADLERVPTSIAFSAYSIPYGNFALNDNNQNPTGWEYTERRSGFSASVGRPLFGDPNFTATLGLEGQWVHTLLETLNPPTNPTVDEATAKSLLPQSYANVSLSTTFDYARVDDPVYPTTGMRASWQVGYGVVFLASGGITYFAPLWGTYKTYMPEDEAGRAVFAVRVAAGTLLGTPPESRYFTLGGSDPEIAMLRGYQPRTFSGQRLLAGSIEYRYDFRLSSSISQTVIGIVFADAGSVWNPGQNPEFHLGYGVGVQLNLGYGAVTLPAIRLDYGFSTQNPSGVLHFRIGPVF